MPKVDNNSVNKLEHVMEEQRKNFNKKIQIDKIKKEFRQSSTPPSDE